MMNPSLITLKTTLILLLTMSCATGAWAQLQPTTAPGATSSYTLEDLYKRLNAGTAGATATFAEPTTGPTTATMHTVNQIMAKAPLLDAANGADASMVLSGKTFWGLLTGSWGATTGTMPNKGAITYTPTSTDQPIAAGYHDGAGKVAGDANLTAENIKKGVTVFGITGTAGQSLLSAATQAPTMTSAGVSFKGVVNPNGLATTVVFQYGTDTNYGTTVTATPSPVSTTSNTAISSEVIMLTVGTTYHVRLITQNIFGTFYGDDITFTYLYYGASYAGGLVFSMDNLGQHGMVCAFTNVEDWKTALTRCNSAHNGYTDWYMPSKSVLNLIYVNLQTQGLGDFGGIIFWSSSLFDSVSALAQRFSDGIQLTKDINFDYLGVMRVRYF